MASLTTMIPSQHAIQAWNAAVLWRHMCTECYSDPIGRDDDTGDREKLLVLQATIFCREAKRPCLQRMQRTS